jgi:hypothetical protein
LTKYKRVVIAPEEIKKRFFFKTKASETVEPCRYPNLGLNLPMDALLINPPLAHSG